MNDRPTREWNGFTIPAPGRYVLDDGHKRCGFVAQHMMVSPVRGEFAQASATIMIGDDPMTSSVSAIIQTASLNTQNPERDTHLRSPDFLDVGKYPLMRYRSNGLKWQEVNDSIFYWARRRNNPLGRRGGAQPLPEQATKTNGRFTLTGELSIKDVTRPVDLDVQFGGARRDPYGQDIFGFNATAEVNREDYGLLWNVALESGGVLVGKKVRIEIAGEAIREV